MIDPYANDPPISQRIRAANLKKAFAEHDIPWPGESRRTLYWHGAGPLLQHGNGVLYIEDLNPELKTKWTMSRGDMLKVGWRFILAALRR